MKNETARSSVTQDPNFKRLKGFLIEHTGLAYYSQREDDLAQRIQRRLFGLNLRDCGTYLALLNDGSQGEQELDSLVAELTIGETYFFRNSEQFEALRHVVFPEILKRNVSKKRLRIWSAGCATGAEPYSISIMLREEFSHLLAGWQVTILGTDVNRKFLGQAREGVFQEWAFRATPSEMQANCFVKAGRGWKIKPIYQEWVSLQYHNLVKHPFPSLVNNLAGFDLILCRNVMIYFDQDLIARMVQQMHETLIDGGWLLVGHADSTVAHFKMFQTLNVHGTTVYRKDNSTLREKADSIGFVENGSRASILSPINAFPKPEIDFSFEPIPEFDFPRSGDEATSLNGAQEKVPEEGPETGANQVGLRARLATIRELANSGDYEKAVAECEQLIARDKLNPKLYFYHALILDQLGQGMQTEQSLKKAIYLDRGFVLAHYHLGLFLLGMARSAAAERSFKNVMKLMEGMAPNHTFEEWDQVSVAQLGELAKMQLEVAQHS